MTNKIKNKLKYLTIILLTMGLFSCSSHDIKKYSKNSPKLDIFEYFDGKLEAYGILRDRSGKVTRSFTVKMTGKVKNDQLTLDESFIFDDGEEQKRIWTINRIDENHFIGGAGDVVGEAKGKQYGNAVQMNYTLTIPYNNSTMNVNIDDWMYLIDEKSLINVSEIKKFGFTVATLSIGFKKLD